MEVVCPRCESRHRFEPPPSSRSRSRALKFRCSDCGNTFPLPTSNEAAAVEAEPPARPGAVLAPVAGRGEPVRLLRQGLQVYPVPDLATLQRWIIEQRVTRMDQVSLHGMRWQAVGDRPDLTLFFAAADGLGGQRPTLAPSPSPFVPPPAVDDEILVDEGTLPVVSSSTGASPIMDANAADDAGPVFPAVPVVFPAARPPEEDRATVLDRGEPQLMMPPPSMLEPDGDTIEAATSAPPRWSAPASLPPPTHSIPPMPDPFFSASPAAHVDVFADEPRPAPVGGIRWWLAGVAALALGLTGAIVWAATRPPAPAPTVAVPAEVGTPAVAQAGSPTPGDAPVVEQAAAQPTVAPAEPPPPAVQPPPAAPAPVPKESVAALPPPAAPKAYVPETAPPKPQTYTATAEAEPTVKKSAPPAESKGSAKEDSKQGWKAIEQGNFSKAHGLFDRALQKDPGGAWPLYGRGYASEKLGDAVSAQQDYCAAQRKGPDAELARELEAGMNRLGAQCS